MATPIANSTIAAASNSAAQNVTQPAVTQPNAGISSANSSISSAAENQGFSAQISAWISSVMDTIRNCLSTLPLIGSWFEKADAAPVPVPPPGPGQTWSDVQRRDMICGQFVASATTTFAVPSNELVDTAVTLFTGIQSPVNKMEAFLAVLNANNSTDEIAKRFYDALPEGNVGQPGIDNVQASKSGFRRQLWASHGSDDGRGLGFGDHIIATDPRGALAKTAALALKNALEAAVSTSAATTSSTTGTTSSTTVARAPDATFVNSIRNILTAADVAGAAVTTPSVVNVVNLITQIQSPLVKLDALEMILASTRLTGAEKRQCFQALPAGTVGTLEASQQALKFQMWEANVRNDEGRVDFGDHVIGNLGTARYDLLVQTAIQNLRAILPA